MQKQRYHLFLYAKQHATEGQDWHPSVSGLGSGYAGTSEGLKFYPGLRFSKDIILRDFEAQEDGSFRMELVKAYHKETRTWFLSSLHVLPAEIPFEKTFVTAEIIDQPMRKY